MQARITTTFSGAGKDLELRARAEGNKIWDMLQRFGVDARLCWRAVRRLSTNPSGRSNVPLPAYIQLAWNGRDARCSYRYVSDFTSSIEQVRPSLIND